MAVLNGCLRTSEAKALLFQGPFQRFAKLWASDLPAALQASLLPQLTSLSGISICSSAVACSHEGVGIRPAACLPDRADLAAS